MPNVIINQQLYEDRTVQNWHRHSFPSTSHAIDLDLMGVCDRCREPLYLIESTTNPQKPLTILKRLAIRSQLPALMIQHDRSTVIRGVVIYPCNVVLTGEPEVHSFLEMCRRIHSEQNHQRQNGGKPRDVVQGR